MISRQNLEFLILDTSLIKGLVTVKCDVTQIYFSVVR
jgi:hypothetical protein